MAAAAQSRSAPYRVAALLAALSVVAGCTDAPTTTGPTVTTTVTTSRPTITTIPEAPVACAADALDVRFEPGEPLDRLLFTNLQANECELDLTASGLLLAESEPNVWLTPGATAEATLAADQPDCTSDSELTITLGPDSSALDVDVAPRTACNLKIEALYSLG